MILVLFVACDCRLCMVFQGLRHDPRLPRALFRAVHPHGEEARINYFLPKDDETALAYEKRRRLGPSLDDGEKNVSHPPLALASDTDEENRRSNSIMYETTSPQVRARWTRSTFLRSRMTPSRGTTHRWMDDRRSVLEGHTTLRSNSLRLCASVDRKYVLSFSPSLGVEY